MPQIKSHSIAWALRLPLAFAVVFATCTLSGGCSTIKPDVATADNGVTRAGFVPDVIRAQSDDGPGPPTTTTPGTLVAGTSGGGAEPESSLPPPSVYPRAGTNPFAVAFKSLFGDAPSSEWTPLSFAGLFAEGWNQPFVFSPASDSGALRQEWINAANGVFYRQWVADYNYRGGVSPSGSRDIGTWTVFAPLSRRLELNIAVPFVDYHREANSNAHPATSPGTSYRASFGDLVITPQVLLSETKNTSIMSVLAIRTPTGMTDAGNGGTSLGPQIQFWQGLPNRWVIRGGAGPTVPMTSTGLHTTFDTSLSIGKFLTLDDVKYFKELTVWVTANNSAVMDHHGAPADTMTILPGLRFRLTPTSWFLYGVEIPLVAPRSEDYGTYVRFVKRF